MSYFNRQKHQVMTHLQKAEAAKALVVKEPLIKDDSEPMQQSAQASQASNQAYQSEYNAPPPVEERIKAHKTAGVAHRNAAKFHRASGKSVMQATPMVGAAHYAQAQMHDRSASSHEDQAQNMQDQKDCGYY